MLVDLLVDATVALLAVVLVATMVCEKAGMTASLKALRLAAMMALTKVGLMAQ